MLMWLPAALALGQARVSSSFNPAVVTAGEIAQFQISVEGVGEASGNLGGQIPKVDGLTISNTASTQQSVSIINGQASRTLSYNFAARAHREGTFTTPPFTITVDGQRVTVPSATLRVVPMGEEMAGAALLSLEGLPETIYAGQALPLQLKLWVRGDIQLRNVGQPTISSDGLVIESIDHSLARQGMQARDGMRYQVISWPILATAVKPGQQNVSYTLPIVIEDPNAQPQRRRSIFDFADPFDRGSLRQIDLENEELATVVSLPQQGQPQDFSGAIGKFDVSPQISTNSTRVGEPVELSLAISGKGNFSQINPPLIIEGNDWRTYPPTSEFQKTGQLGNEGVLNLDYLLTPMEAGTMTLPPVRFTYFDPERREYVVHEIPQETVTVAQSERAAPVVRTAGEQREEPRAPQERLNPIELLPSQSIGELKPLFLKPTFWAAQALPALALAGLLGMRIRQRHLEAHPDRQLAARHRNAARRALKTAQQAAAKGDGASFYLHGRQSLQNGAAAVLQRESSTSIDAATVRDALNVVNYGEGNPEEIFKAFDARRYGGVAANGNIAAHEQNLRAMVGALTGRRRK